MAGETNADEVSAYLARLLGHAVSAEQSLQLRSVHRAAFVSWARGRTLPVRLALITSGKPFSVQQLLSPDDGPAPATVAAEPAAVRQMQPTAGGGTVLGVGIDIEDVEALPHAEDYREHAFFKDNFTSAELSHCLRQADVRASFCGTWAAKEAVLKSGLLAAAPAALNAIEIARDQRGRPMFPGCHLSISHTATSAVAVCVATSEAPIMALTTAPIAPPPAPAAKPVPAPGRGRSALQGLFSRAAAVLAATILGGGALSLALGAWH